MIVMVEITTATMAAGVITVPTVELTRPMSGVRMTTANGLQCIAPSIVIIATMTMTVQVRESA